MTRWLVVPMKVDALVVPDGKRRAVLGPTTDPTTLPWFDGVRDRWPATPNIAPAMHAEPFADHALWLEPGVHLHWALPDGLTRGTTRADAPGVTPVGDLHFPPVPNRWLVMRHGAPDDPDGALAGPARWIVESDVVDTDPDGGGSNGVAILWNDGSGRPWVRLGAQRRLDPGEQYNERHDVETLAALHRPLTALGPGDPEFSALYANCRSVLGAHDPDPAVAGRRYDVLGWYAGVVDPIEAVVEDALAAGADAVAALLDRFGWKLPENARELPRGTMCVGRVTLEGSDGDWDPQTLDRATRAQRERVITAPVAVGSTPTEAVAAALSAHLGDGTVERRLEAVHLAPTVAHHDLDFGLAFDEARHTAQFTGVAGRRSWALRPAPHHGSPTPGQHPPEPDLPPTLVDDLHDLNRLQRRVDDARLEIDWLRQELHGRWQQLMTGLYAEPPDAPDDLDLSGLEALIERDYLVPLEALLDGSMAAALAARHAAVTADLARFNVGRDGLDTLELALVPGPRYWRPNEPVVLLPDTRHADADDPDASTPPRHGVDGELRCAMVDPRDVVPALMGDRTWSLDRYLPRTFFDDHPQLVTRSDGAPWNPVLLEWEAELRPLTEGGNHGDGPGARPRYRTGFVTDAHDLPPDGADLVARDGDPSLADGFEYLSGRTVLQASALRVLREQVRDAIEELDSDADAAAALRTIAAALDDPRYASATVQSLGGFHDALLMRRAEPQPPVADPLGFPREQALAARVARVLDGFHPDSVAPDAAFHPIRSGRLVIERLRLVDSFGQTREWRPSTVHTSESMRATVADRVHLPVRITQPAMLSLRWAAAGRPDLEMHDHPDTGPVCGWLLGNLLDGAIDVYDAEGHQLGVVEADGRWRPAPGAVTPPAAPGAIPDRTLAAVVGWIVTRPDPHAAVSAFLATTGQALDDIDPADHRTHEARALLIGRPMAVANATVDLRLAGRPAVDQSWRHLRERILGAAPDSHGMEHVGFRVRLGDRGKVGDGLVAFWEVDDQGTLDARWRHHYGGEPEITVTVAAPPRRLVVLVDPRGSVHAVSGVLPTKEIRIPPSHTGEALRSIAATFRAAPLLTAADRVEAPLPGEPGFSWSWLQRTDAGWIEVPEHESVDLDDVLTAFPGRGREVWDAAVAAGVLEPGARTPRRARLRSEPPGAGRDGAHGPTLDDADLRALHAVAASIRPAPTDATFGSPTVIREGWLKLRPQETP